MILDELKAGHRFDAYTFAVSAEEAAAYVEAVGDASPSASDPGIVPPMAVIAAGLSRMIEMLALSGGTIHAAQEVAFERSSRVGEQLSAKSTLRANSVRRGARFATVHTEFLGSDGLPVARSTSTVIVPA